MTCQAGRCTEGEAKALSRSSVAADPAASVTAARQPACRSTPAPTIGRRARSGATARRSSRRSRSAPGRWSSTWNPGRGCAPACSGKRSARRAAWSALSLARRWRRWRGSTSRPRAATSRSCSRPPRMPRSGSPRMPPCSAPSTTSCSPGRAAERHGHAPPGGAGAAAAASGPRRGWSGVNLQARMMHAPYVRTFEGLGRPGVTWSSSSRTSASVRSRSAAGTL